MFVIVASHEERRKHFLPLDFPSGSHPLSWLFFVIFVPLMLASLHFCGTDSSLRRWKPTFEGGLDSDGQREFWRFLRSNEAVPDPRVAPAVVEWAEHVSRQDRCVWDRVINWAWVLWISAGLVGAIAFGRPRDVAVKLIVFDLLLIVVRLNQFSRRRAQAVLVAQRR